MLDPPAEVGAGGKQKGRVEEACLAGRTAACRRVAPQLQKGVSIHAQLYGGSVAAQEMEADGFLVEATHAIEVIDRQGHFADAGLR